MNLGIESIGPGLYRAITAVISSMLFAFRPTQTPVIPALSSWNTPLVLPAASIS